MKIKEVFVFSSYNEDHESIEEFVEKVEKFIFSSNECVVLNYRGTLLLIQPNENKEYILNKLKYIVNNQ